MFFFLEETDRNDKRNLVPIYLEKNELFSLVIQGTRWAFSTKIWLQMGL